MTEETVRIENCRVAMKAALEAIQDYCGESGSASHTGIRLAAVSHSIPNDIVDIAKDDRLSESDRVVRISQSDWAQEIATKVCNDLMTGEQAISTCVGGIIGRIGELVVAKLMPEGSYALAEDERSYADRYRE